MSTQVFLSNDPSGISGYLLAYIGGPSPNASTTVSTAVTNTSVITTTTIAMTLTAGGTAAKWITAPFKDAVTISNSTFNTDWGKESSASANAQIAFAVSQYTTSLQSAFLTTSIGSELTTAIARYAWVSTETVTSTAFAAGDRLAAGKAKAKAYVYADWDEALMNAIRDDWAKLKAVKPGEAPAVAPAISRRTSSCRNAGSLWAFWTASCQARWPAAPLFCMAASMMAPAVAGVRPLNL